ncbi:hypothetical protein USDA257_c01950 [Sinorhizobium fredii USDA 257]|uniref:Uncharacterized protein n=1 Tax=Sinorhizobium fredii (strain USDA 257) TaxID=1185652 RepID=I3WYT9_SINF2|nr:hypothetical protein USDA257_c01950 [Sinorhizobium fredii USDA 257]
MRHPCSRSNVTRAFAGNASGGEWLPETCLKHGGAESYQYAGCGDP